MKRSTLVSMVVLVAALALTLVAVVRVISRAPRQGATEPEVVATPAGATAVDEAAPAVASSDAMRRLNVFIYYPSAEDDGLVGEPHEIFMTPAPGDRAKQILADLIAGPDDPSRLRALPQDTRLRQVYVLTNGTAYVDFSAELKQGMRGGSIEELFTVYSIVNSIALNTPEIRRVGILIEGQPVDTLNGHLDLRRPIPPNMAFVVR